MQLVPAQAHSRPLLDLYRHCELVQHAWMVPHWTELMPLYAEHCSGSEHPTPRTPTIITATNNDLM